ncbi:MAG: hypothetical protein AB7G39_13300 [Alphaproteobacteria bacterium]
MSGLKTAIPLVGALLLLTACGSNQGDRALSGAGIGAGGGALLGWALPGIGPAAGAAIGAVGGAVTGAVTDDEDLNLGKPAWR